MKLQPALLALKTQADNEWINAQALEVQDEDMDAIEEKFQAAFATYQQVYKELKSFDKENALLSNLDKLEVFDLIHLYYIYKTLANAHYDMGEFSKAEKLYQKALHLLEVQSKHFAEEVREKRSLSYNFALDKATFVL